MTAKNRRELKQKFRTGAQPTAQDYADVLDSGFNGLDDGINKPLEPYLPVRIKGNGAGLNILDFYNDDTHHWRISLLADSDSGYNIADPSGRSHFFMEDGTGNIGLGMSKPKGKLHINQADDAGDAVYIEDFKNDATPTRITNAGNIYVRSEVTEGEVDDANFYVNGDTRVVNESTDASFLHINRHGAVSFNALTDALQPQIDMHCPMNLHGALVVEEDVEIKGKLTVFQEMDIKSVAQGDGGTIQLGDTNGDQVSIRGKLNSGDAEPLQINDSLNVHDNFQINSGQAVSEISNELGTGTSKTKLLTELAIHQILPKGAIIMWAGGTDSIPAGWALCDGTRQTPDLTDRFIIGAGGSKNANATGGNETVTLTTRELPSHSHTASENGNHRHAVNEVKRGDDGGNSTQYIDMGKKNLHGGFHTDHAGSHSHTISSTGEGKAFSIMPPYYALCFIQKQTG